MIITIDNKPYNFPQSFAEMTVEQIAVYVKEFILNRDALFEEDKQGKWVVKNEMLFNKAMMKMLFYLLPLNWHRFTQMDVSWKQYLAYEAKLMDFLFKETLDTLPKTQIKVRGRRLNGPKVATLIATEEFSFADKLYTTFFKHQNTKHLNLFVAALYRPAPFFNAILKHLPQFNGDNRVRFNKHLLEAHAKPFERIPFDEKLVVWFWYHCYRSTLPKKHPHIFTPSNEKQADDGNWLNVILSISTEGPFGNYKEVCTTQVHLVLTQLDRQAAINQEMQKKYAK